MRIGRIVATLLLVAAIGLVPGLSAASSHECGGPWVSGFKCELEWNGAPATGTGTATGLFATVDVRLTDSHGVLLGSCSGAGLFTASCTFTTNAIPTNTLLPLFCYVSGSVGGTYACEG